MKADVDFHLVRIELGAFQGVYLKVIEKMFHHLEVFFGPCSNSVGVHAAELLERSEQLG